MGAFGLILAGCGGGGDAPAQGGSGGSAAAASSGSATGMAECDEYVEKYTACIEKHVPAAMQPALRQSMEQARQAWAQAKTASAEARAPGHRLPAGPGRRQAGDAVLRLLLVARPAARRP